MGTMSAIRSFIAVEMSAPIQQKLDETIRRMQGSHTSAVRWVPARNIHLTLKFLGDSSPAQMNLLTQMLKSQVSQETVFSISVGGVGAFPSAHRPRVLWVGVTAPAELFSLASKIEIRNQPAGLPTRRPAIFSTPYPGPRLPKCHHPIRSARFPKPWLPKPSVNWVPPRSMKSPSFAATSAPPAPNTPPFSRFHYGNRKPGI